MELGSKEHKKLLQRGIFKVAQKTMLVSVGIAIFLNIPAQVRENTFSQGLSYAGQAIFVIGIVYALVIAFNKYRQIILPFEQQHSK